jgi:hypothetical protein
MMRVMGRIANLFQHALPAAEGRKCGSKLAHTLEIHAIVELVAC